MTTTNPTTGRRWSKFALHYVEMIVAMFVGMFGLGALQSALGLDVSHETSPELWYLIMAANMSVGMAAWMRFRGHRWLPTLEMCGVMFVPIVPLYPMLWLGVIDPGGLMLISHIAMFPLMLAAMLWRVDEYAGCAH